MVLHITADNTIESYRNTIEWSNGTEWYSIVFNGIQWHIIGSFLVRASTQ